MRDSVVKEHSREVMKNRRKLGSSTQHHLRNIRIAVMGQDGVGKSALTVRFLTKRFIGEYAQTLESTTRHHTEVNGEFLALDIQDTAGKNTEAKLQACLEFADIFLVLYSITDRASFHEAGKIVKYIRRRKTLHSSSIIIAATKRDLEHLRNVQETDGTKLTYSLNCSFYEISIADSFGETMDMFQDILRHYLIAHPTGEPSLSSTASTSPLTSLFPASPTAIRKEIKSSSSWTKVKGLKTMPFRKKSAQTAVC